MIHFLSNMIHAFLRVKNVNVYKMLEMSFVCLLSLNRV